MSPTPPPPKVSPSKANTQKPSRYTQNPAISAKPTGITKSTNNDNKSTRSGAPAKSLTNTSNPTNGQFISTPVASKLDSQKLAAPKKFVIKTTNPPKVVAPKQPIGKVTKPTNGKATSISTDYLTNPAKTMSLTKFHAEDANLIHNVTSASDISGTNCPKMVAPYPSLETFVNAVAKNILSTTDDTDFDFTNLMHSTAAAAPQTKDPVNRQVAPTLQLQASPASAQAPLAQELQLISTDALADTLTLTFSKFPLEIRQEIWTLAAANAEGRIVSVSVISDDQKWRIPVNQAQLRGADLIKTDSKAPSLMCVNHEARRAAKQFYERIAGERYGQAPIYFHFGVDTLFVKSFHAWTIMFGLKSHNYNFYNLPEQENTIVKLRYLTIDMPFNLNLAMPMEILKQLPSLKVLSL